MISCACTPTCADIKYDAKTKMSYFCMFVQCSGQSLYSFNLVAIDGAGIELRFSLVLASSANLAASFCV